MKKRLHNLDYLRGLAAFGIMIYHYMTWTFGSYGADTFLGRLGLYGVSIFYVLSGLTLYYVYFHKMKPNRQELQVFYRKRIFRIFPLLWIVTIVAIILSKKLPDFLDLFLNLSGLFGFVKWDAYFSPGAWSIGNELVFYAFFPIFVLLTKRSKPLMGLFSLLIFGIYLYFAFSLLDSKVGITEQWKNYIHPLNQVFLFLAGFLIGEFLREVKIREGVLFLLLIMGMGLFIFYPVEGDRIHLLTGVNRLVFTLCCLLVTISFFKTTLTLPDFLHKPLTLLGEASYSVYLIHPLVYTVVGFVFKVAAKYGLELSDPWKVPIGIVATLIISYFVYEYFEKYFMKLGRQGKKVAAKQG